MDYTESQEEAVSEPGIVKGGRESLHRREAVLLVPLEYAPSSQQWWEENDFDDRRSSDITSISN